MYKNVSQEFGNIIADSGRTFKAKMVNGANEITDVRSFTLYQAENGSDNIGIGGGIAGYIDCTIGNTDLPLENVEYDLYIGLKISGDIYEYVPVGKFIPKKPVIKSEVTTFTAYDRMMSNSFSAGFFSDIESYPADVRDILLEIERQTGINVDISNLPSGLMIDKRAVITDSGVDEEGNELQNTTYEKPFTGYTIRETVCYIAQMFGRFAYIDRYGIVRFRWFEDCGLQYIESQYKDDVEQSESEFVLGVIKCSTGPNELVSGAGATGISIENPVMTQTILDNVYQLVGGFRCKGISVTLLGDIRLDVGDIIQIRRNGEYIEIPVMKLETTYDGGISQKVYAFGNVDSIEEQKGPTAERLDRMYNELLLVKEVVANKVSTDSLEARVANLGFASIKELTTEVAKMGLLTANQADIAYAKIDFSNIKKATIGQMFADIGLVSDMTIVDGHITGTLSGVKITGDLFEANTIKADSLLLTGEDGVIYRINATASGLSKEELSDEKYQKYLSGTDIVSESITTKQLASNSVTAEKMYLKNLSSVTADLGTVTAGIIQSTNYSVDDKGNVATGLQLDLNSGTWYSKYTKIDSEGAIACSDISIIGGMINIETSEDLLPVIQTYCGESIRMQIMPNELYSYSNGEYISVKSEAIEAWTQMQGGGKRNYRYRLDEWDCICESGGYSFSDIYRKVNTFGNACNYNVTTIVTSGSSNLITSGGVFSRLSNIHLYAGPVTNAKALNISCNNCSYDANAYIVVITDGAQILFARIIFGYTASATLQDVSSNNMLSIGVLNASAAGKVSSVAAINDGKTNRVKIMMSTSSNGYRGWIIPLGTKPLTNTYVANWATS